MQKSIFTVGIVALIAGSTATAAPINITDIEQRGYVDSIVSSGIYIGNRPAPAALVGNFLNSHLESNAAAVPNMTLTTPLPGQLGMNSSNAQISITVEELSATTRRVHAVWETLDGSPFLAVGTQADGGLTATDLIFTFGMSHLGPIPGAATNGFDDNAFIRVLSNVGTLYNDSGQVLVDMNAQLRLEEQEGFGFFGRLFFQRRDPATGLPNLEDITERRVAKYEATIIYEVPSPGAMALLGISGLAVARRRRR
ncbi:MAG: PEP-CTERM sorting domain-containing protein [Phycisphaeraceae bacterium]|nr:MAG: PEP-CTERM sorting domain-containing protein [Phycisphaeraceae bacterium]